MLAIFIFQIRIPSAHRLSNLLIATEQYRMLKLSTKYMFSKLIFKKSSYLRKLSYKHQLNA